MSNDWYYAADDKAVGPLSLHDLIAVLSQHTDAGNFLVWHSGYAQWQRAAAVPELRAIIKPPPIPSSPVPAPAPKTWTGEQALRVSDGDYATKGSGLKGSKLASGISVGLVVALVTGLRVLLNSNATPPLDPTTALSGRVRDSFVEAGMKTCLNHQETDPETKALSFSADTLTSYCSCYMNAIADATTYGELKQQVAGALPDALRRIATAASASCIDKMRRSLLGGSK